MIKLGFVILCKIYCRQLKRGAAGVSPEVEEAMDVEEALALAELLVFAKTGKHLSTLQVAIFRGAWSGQKYEQIAQTCYCSDAYVKMVGAALWELLSQGLEEKLSKKTFRAALERRGRFPTDHTAGTLVKAVPSPQVEGANANPPSRLGEAVVPTPLESSDSLPAITEPELPSGQVELGSKFYVERPPDRISLLPDDFQAWVPDPHQSPPTDGQNLPDGENSPSGSQTRLSRCIFELSASGKQDFRGLGAILKMVLCQRGGRTAIASSGS